jgi:DNA-binding response OmpR family regulator
MRILLVEDEVDLGSTLVQSLTREGYIVDWSQDGLEAWSYLDPAWNEYTIVIMDWILPGISGLELCRRLRKAEVPVLVLMLTARDRIEDRVTGLDAGADDYLVKPFGMTELLARLRALQRRSPQFQPPLIQVGAYRLNYGNHCLEIDRPGAQKAVGIGLTHKEFQFLEFLMSRPGQVIPTERLRSQLWELRSESMSNVVASLVRLLRRKLADRGCDGFIETVHGLGYRVRVEQ